MKDVIEYIFKGFISVIMAMSLYILKDFDDSIDKMQNSVNTLNINVATMTEKLVNQKSRIERIEKKIEKMQDF